MAMNPRADSTAICLGEDWPRRHHRSRDEDFISDYDDTGSLFHPELTPGKTVKCWFFFVMTLAILIFMSTSLTAVPTQILFGTFITVFLMMLACIPLAIFDCKRARQNNNYISTRPSSDANNLLIRCELSSARPTITACRSSGHPRNWPPPTYVIIPSVISQNTSCTEAVPSSQSLDAQIISNPMDEPPPYNLVNFTQPIPDVHTFVRDLAETPPPPYENVSSS